MNCARSQLPEPNAYGEEDYLHAIRYVVHCKDRKEEEQHGGRIALALVLPMLPLAVAVVSLRT